MKDLEQKCCDYLSKTPFIGISPMIIELFEVQGLMQNAGYKIEMQDVLEGMVSWYTSKRYEQIKTSYYDYSRNLVKHHLED